MDMTPPQAPPAQMQSVYQEASDAFDRVVGLQAWLAKEQAGLPDLPDTVDATTLASYLLAVDAYWSAPPEDASHGTSRRAAVTARILNAARDLAVLAHQDGELDEAGLNLVRSIASGPGGNLPAGVTVRELLFGQSVYAGTLLIQYERTPNQVLVFSTERGWESFPRLVDAHAALEARARLALARAPGLAGIARQELISIGPEAFVDSREIAGDPFGTLVARTIRVQQDKLRQAWFEFSLANDDEAAIRALADARFDALRMDHVFDAENVLATRHAALMAAFNAQRLARVPMNVAAEWRDAESGYLSVQDAVADSEAAVDLRAPLDLPSYASIAISERLRALGVAEDAANIQVRVDRGSDPIARLESLQALFEGTVPAQIRLVDLAYQNIAAFEPVRLTASTNEGVPIARLDDAAIRDLVRGLDLASSYRTYVNATFRSGNDAPMRRQHATSLQHGRMRFLAAEARLSYYLEDSPRSFRADHSERGYSWVKAVLAAPAETGRARVEGHDVVVRQNTYRGAPLRDILTIGVRHPESVPSIVLYTPDAPDGVTFREFEDRAEAGRRFFYHPAFREYLLDRLPVEFARVLPNGSGRAFAGERLANWVLGASAPSAYTWTAAPFEEREVSGNFLAAAYEVDVQLGLRNAHTFTRSAEQANWAWLTERVGNAMTHRMIEDAIKGVVTSPARAAQAAWRLYDNVKAGDNVGAFVDFADFYNASLSAALPAYMLGSRSVAHAITGARFRVGGRLVEAKAAVQPTVVFESQYVAKQVRKTGRADHEGIFTIGGNTYIEQNGQLHRVIRDRDYGGWRLTRPDGSNVGPAIQRTSIHTWGHRRVGLRAGSGRGQGAGSDRLPDLYDELQAEVELAFPDPVERELVATRMRFERAALPDPAMSPPVISPGQRLRWTGALERARARQSTRAALPGVPGAAAPVDLTPGAGPFRLISRAEAPPDLWYYDNKPFQTSGFERQRGASGYLFSSTSHGYSNDVAEIASGYVGQGISGVRLTTVPPTASLAEINQAMGTHHIIRSRGFAVRVDPRSLYEPPSPHVRQRYLGANGDRNARLIAPNGGPGNVFIARPLGGGPLRLGRGQFEVMNTLPAQAPGRTP